MQRILLCTDGSDYARNSYFYAAWLAQRLNASVDVLYVTDARSQSTAQARNLSGSIGLGATKALLNQLVELEHEKAKLEHQRAKHLLEEAEETLRTAGVEQVKLIHETGFLVDYLQELGVDADLIVLGKRGENSQFAASHLGSNLERILRSCHHPCLVTSQQTRPIEQVCLAYDGSESCQKLQQFILDSPLFADLSVHLITVGRSRQDEKAIARLAEAQNAFRRSDFTPISDLLVGHPEIEIAKYNKQHKIDLLLLGAYGHSRIRQLVIGSTTAQILRSTEIPVLAFR
ncbi:MAG: universal stress protein [Cyanobacteria bacterium P01_H01_bin.15]